MTPAALGSAQSLNKEQEILAALGSAPDQVPIDLGGRLWLHKGSAHKSLQERRKVMAALRLGSRPSQAERSWLH